MNAVIIMCCKWQIAGYIYLYLPEKTEYCGEPERPAIDLAPAPDHTFSPTCKKNFIVFH